MNFSEPLSPTPVPSGLTPFVLPDGTRFELDLVEANRELNRLADTHKDATNSEHLEPWTRWVEKETGVTLRTAQAEWLWEHVLYLRATAKKNFMDALRSLSSTDSTPAD